MKQQVFTQAVKSTKNFLSQAGLEKPKILLGLSGGPDSVFLLHVLAELQKQDLIKVVAAHVDHEWRTNSADDATFCQSLCEKLKTPFYQAKASKFSKQFKFNGSEEELGRKIRLAFFNNLVNELSASAIALAHHAQDQQETFLIRLTRGAGLDGLACMQKFSPPYIRPLLDLDKAEILNFLEQNQIPFLTDPSNQSSKFLRNRIRHNLLPQLKAVDNRLPKKLLTSIQILQQDKECLNQLISQVYTQVFNDQKIGDLTLFKKQSKVIQKKLLLKWLCAHEVQFTPSTKFYDEALRFLNSPRGGKHQLGTNWYIYKKHKIFMVIINS